MKNSDQHQNLDGKFARYVIVTILILITLVIIISIAKSKSKTVNNNLSLNVDTFREEIIFGDIKIKLNSDIFSHEQLQNEIKEKDLIDFLNANIKKGDTIIYTSFDIGVQQLLMAKLVSQSGKVYVFNPVENYSNAIAFSAKINGFENRIITKSVSVSDKNFDGLIVYKNGTSESDGILHEANYKLPDGYNALKVKVSTIDELCSQLQNVNFLRISVTNNISKIIQGAQNLINRSPNIQIIIDYDVDKTKDLTAIEQLKKQGFNIYILRKNAKLDYLIDINKIEEHQAILVIKK